MASPTTEDLRNFSERVERLCDFLLEKTDDKDSPDANVVRTLKRDSADFQHVRIDEVRLYGLDNHMRGLPT